MSNYFKGKYLRVQTPITTNGILQKIGSDGKAEYEETFLPLSAKKELEKKNRHLERTGTPHLKAIIEEVGEKTI